jgi:carbamoyl-phosphate synthase large subunit
VIGSGPIVIGQAGEFDYSGTQACRCLRRRATGSSLVNSNPATIMTDPEFADATYVEPLDVETLAAIIARERPDALLPTLGGQTALNLAVALARGGRAGGSRRGADRRRRRGDPPRRGPRPVPRVHARGRHPGARQPRRGERRGGPCGDGGPRPPAHPAPGVHARGGGGRRGRHPRGLDEAVAAAIAASPIGQVLVERSVTGWGEFEMEVVRDHADNAVIVCSIENLDPMGVHTGDSVTVAPAMTLTDDELQRMRDASLAVIRAVGVETGGSNVQFALDRATGDMVVIEMNPRVSRSSALASKATGFPIAKIAARLAVGYTLDELPNDITAVTPASFEPALDYVAIKMPRFAFEKVPGVTPILTTFMQSVGEVLTVGAPSARPSARRCAPRRPSRPGSGRTGRRVGRTPTVPGRTWPPCSPTCGCPPTAGCIASSMPCGSARRWSSCTTPPGSIRGSLTRSS